MAATVHLLLSKPARARKEVADTEDEEAYRTFLAERSERIHEKIQEALEKAGRGDEKITLAAVSKTVGPEEVALAWQEGYRVFAENRPQELRRKLEAIEGNPSMAGVRFDMIGNFQTNKVNMVVGKVGLIQSVSSVHLAETISKHSLARNLVSKVLLEVNVSGEQSKSGFAPDELRASMDTLQGMAGIQIEGLMTMAPAHDPDAARRTFSGLRELAEELRARTALRLPELSCGMSDDFPIALEEGSTLIRLGRVVFSPDYELK